MQEVNTKDELKKALALHRDDIHIADDKLCIGLATRPHKFRFIRYMMHAFGYRMVVTQRLGCFDATFIKQDDA